VVLRKSNLTRFWSETQAAQKSEGDNSAEPSEVRLTSRSKVWTIVACESEIGSRLWIILLFDKS
jgi:hypothetical protein